jgi:signal transduction histidine kinase
MIWLLTGHTAQITLATPASDWSTNFGIFGFIILALFGLEVPFNVAAETKRASTARVGLVWGSIIIGLGYLIGTFGLTTVLSLKTPPSGYTVLAAMYTVFGWPVVLIAGSIFFVVFLSAAVIFNITFARILFVAALDSRLPARLTRLNRYKAPYYATNVQTIIILCLAVLGCIVGPLLFPGISSHFTTQFYDVLLAVISIIWFLSLIFLFLDLPVLLHRVRRKIARKQEGLMIPTWAVYLCCAIGISTTCIGILTVLSAPFDTFFSADSWSITVGVLVSVILLLGLGGAAYPRLLSSVQEQMAMARENARLYEDLRVAYEKLYQLDQMKDAFLSTVSHELRTPLTIVQGYVELLGEMTDEHLDPETRRVFINNVRRGCDELSLLLANIMDASTLPLDTATLHCKNLLLKEVCISVLDLFEQVIAQQRRELEINIPADCVVYADEMRLKQILRNLILNALRYSPEETPLRIVATFENERTLVRTAVIDRGSGVPVEKQSAIFDRFVRLERDMHGDVRGSGLGLAICQQLVEAMQGTIMVESSGVPGEGSTFSFTLSVGRS